MARKLCVILPESEIEKDTGPVKQSTKVVVVTGGGHRGKVGFMDEVDEDSLEDYEGDICADFLLTPKMKGIIYFGMPCFDDSFYLIKSTQLRPATKEEEALYFLKRCLISKDPKRIAAFCNPDLRDTIMATLGLPQTQEDLTLEPAGF